jgi:hypothetical protein
MNNDGKRFDKANSGWISAGWYGHQARMLYANEFR